VFLNDVRLLKEEMPDVTSVVVGKSGVASSST